MIAAAMKRTGVGIDATGLRIRRQPAAEGADEAGTGKTSDDAGVSDINS
jgi:hypothetical protein